MIFRKVEDESEQCNLIAQTSTLSPYGIFDSTPAVIYPDTRTLDILDVQPGSAQYVIIFLMCNIVLMPVFH